MERRMMEALTDEELETLRLFAHEERLKRDGLKRGDKHASFIGRYFRYKNCYSCPQNEADHWWLYVTFERIAEDGRLSGWSFQRDSKNVITIGDDRNLDLVERLTEISECEFFAAYQAILTDLIAKARK